MIMWEYASIGEISEPTSNDWPTPVSGKNGRNLVPKSRALIETLQ
jgi:hypothetical protein